MKPVDIIVVAVVVIILGVTGWYIYKSRKNGKKCIGCPDCNVCQGNCSKK